MRRSAFVPFSQGANKSSCNTGRNEGEVTKRLEAEYPLGEAILNRLSGTWCRRRYPVGDRGHVPQKRQRLSVRNFIRHRHTFCGHTPESSQVFPHPTLPINYEKPKTNQPKTYRDNYYIEHITSYTNTTMLIHHTLIFTIV